MRGGLATATDVGAALSDVVTELASGGNDTFETTLSYTLGAELENLLLTGAGAVNGTGNSLANVLTGNGGKESRCGTRGPQTRQIIVVSRCPSSVATVTASSPRSSAWVHHEWRKV